MMVGARGLPDLHIFQGYASGNRLGTQVGRNIVMPSMPPSIVMFHAVMGTGGVKILRVLVAIPKPAPALLAIVIPSKTMLLRRSLDVLGSKSIPNSGAIPLVLMNWFVFDNQSVHTDDAQAVTSVIVGNDVSNGDIAAERRVGPHQVIILEPLDVPPPEPRPRTLMLPL